MKTYNLCHSVNYYFFCSALNPRPRYTIAAHISTRSNSSQSRNFRDNWRPQDALFVADVFANQRAISATRRDVRYVLGTHDRVLCVAGKPYILRCVAYHVQPAAAADCSGSRRICGWTRGFVPSSHRSLVSYYKYIWSGNTVRMGFSNSWAR